VCHAAQLSDHERRLAIAVIANALREADLMADLVIRFLEAVGLAPPLARRMKQPAEFPREFLLELGFILRIHTWERSGIRHLVGPDLPRARQALEQLFVRHGIIPGPPGDPSAGDRLSLQVMRIALGRLAPAGREELDADIVVVEADDTRLLEALADFAWSHRRPGYSGE
jgi:hypothetical protein